MLRKIFFGGEGLLFRLTSVTILDNKNICNFFNLTKISIMRLYINTLALTPGACQASAPGRAEKIFF
ncbi:hypothetical protein N39L_54780 [Limnospira platensis NIES-39]|uniref:Uncharacterized protein n=1 Tax=Limnospira platensis NIES-46 TaxID=1236695 RepID=A0A5M3TE91_LIMPL|nr:hypothetical protein N39L_54780 [Arthrospira platensis NIES-39]GCE96308.1 hypothetical protein NIES46_43770 [Arthrospira platensis NIES-46]